MAWRETWGLRLFLAGIALGLGLMTFVVTVDSSSFYLNYVASSAPFEATPLLGYLLDGGILLSMALTVGGIACFPSRPVEARVPVTTPAPRASRHVERAQPRDSRRRFRPARPSAPHGST